MAATTNSVPSPYRPTTLYVGDLHPDVTQQMLYEEFAKISADVQVRLCVTSTAEGQRSRGYAYVNYLKADDAERALNTYAGRLFLGRPCRIMWSQKDPTLRRTGIGNLFIKNLPPSVKVETLQTMFSVYGNILSSKIALDDRGHSKGFGFVHLESADAAKQAAEDLNGTELEGQKIYVGQHIAKRARGNPSDTKWTNVYVKNLPAEFQDEAKIREVFGKYGEITSVFPRTHTFSKNGSETEPVTRVFAFINFAQHEDARKCAESVNDTKFGDLPVYAGRAQSKAERTALLRTSKRDTAKTNLYIKFLEPEITKEILEKHFAQFGTITSAKIVTEPSTGVSRGYGFVNFAQPEAARIAVTDANHRAIPGFTVPLYVGYFEPKDVRKANAEHNRSAYQQFGAYPYPPYAIQGGRHVGGMRGPSQGQQFRAPRSTGPRNNMPVMPMMAPSQQRHPHQPNLVPAPIPAGKLPSRDELRKMPKQSATTAIGDFLYNYMAQSHPQRNGKITGMLLSIYGEVKDGQDQFDNLIELVHNTTELNAKINEANDILAESTN